MYVVLYCCHHFWLKKEQGHPTFSPQNIPGASQQNNIAVDFLSIYLQYLFIFKTNILFIHITIQIQEIK